MRSYIFTLILSSFCSILVGQDRSLSGHFQVTKNNVRSEYQLIIGNSYALWREVSDPESIEFDASVLPTDSHDREVMFKDRQNDVYLTKYSVLGGTFRVADTLNRLPWILSSTETAEILGFDCRKATLQFRGREYSVWYAPDIPVSEGPWKFSGLPGMILKATTTSLGEFYQLECIRIDQQAESIDREFVKYQKRFRRKTPLSWSGFMVAVDDHLNRVVQSIRAEFAADGETGFNTTLRSVNHLELFSEEAQINGIYLEF